MKRRFYVLRLVFLSHDTIFSTTIFGIALEKLTSKATFCRCVMDAVDGIRFRRCINLAVAEFIADICSPKKSCQNCIAMLNFTQSIGPKCKFGLWKMNFDVMNHSLIEPLFQKMLERTSSRMPFMLFFILF